MPGETSASFPYDVRFMRNGKHSAIIFLPEAYHAPIGLVIAYWGHFESTFDKLLLSLIAGEKNDGGSRIVAPMRQFKRRRALFKAICSEWLSTWQPDEAAALCQLADTAGDLSWKRNMIAHGNYVYTIPPRSSIATNCRAVNHGTGEEFLFDIDVLKKLYHDISHLTADMFMIFERFGQIEGQFYVSPDAEILRVYREANHPWNPNPRRRTPMPESSGD